MALTLDTVETLSDVPGAVAHYLSGLNLRPQAVVWTTLQSLDRTRAGIDVESRPPVYEAQVDQGHGDFVGIMGCFCAIAETGSPMLLSGSENVALAALLPEIHIAAVSQSRTVANLEDTYALIRMECDELPCVTNVISEPPHTGDIEQTIVLGAHGPYRIHVIVVITA